MSSATTHETPHLQNMLTRFGVKRLGEGDTAAGANLLAAMACSLANLQRPGSGLATEDGETIAVGTSILVSGGHSVSLISEKVLAGLATCQNNLVSHLSNKIQSDEEESKKKSKWSAASSSPEDFMAGFQKPMLDTIYKPQGFFNTGNVANAWSNLVNTPVEPNLKDLMEQPVVFVTGITPETLGRQLERSHLGRPLMHVGVVSARDFPRFEQICPTIMDGRITSGSTMTSIRGTVMVTDPSGALDEAVKADLPNARWVSRLLWLVDGDAGSEPGKPVDDNTLIPLDRLAVRYQTAMSKAWGERLNNQTTAPETVKFEFTKSQARWMAFLKSLEPQCPGISGTARNLYATLGFGLSRLVSAIETTPVFKWSTDDAEALARFLVKRMVNARAAMLHSAEDEWKRQLMEKILIKLMDGPLEHRAIIRRFHKLSTVQCLQFLNILENKGQVTRVENMWCLPQHANTIAAPLQLTHVA